MFISQKRYEVRCLVELLETISKFFPETDVSVTSSDGKYIVSFRVLDKIVDITMRDFIETRVTLHISMTYYNNVTNNHEALGLEDIEIDTFFIHHEVTKALTSLGVVKTNVYTKLLGDKSAG